MHLLDLASYTTICGKVKNLSEITSLVAQMVNSLPAMRETQVQSLGGEDPLEKEMGTHSGTLAWEIPWTGETGGLRSMASQSWTRLSEAQRSAPPSRTGTPSGEGRGSQQVSGLRRQTLDPGCWVPALVLPAPCGLGQMPCLLN